MKKFKFILMICIVTVLIFTMTVATFANDPLTEGGEELVKIENENIYATEFRNTLSLDEYTLLRFYLNGIGYKPVFTDQTVYEGYFVNIYNSQDILWSGDLTIYSDELSFDYIVMPLWIWTELVEELGYNDDIAIPIDSNNSILGTISAIPGFMISIITPLITLFWANGSFTFIGVLALASLAFALILLLFNVIRKFIAFRG